MDIKEIVEQEKVNYELWRRLASGVKESQWATVVRWLEEDFPRYPEKVKRDVLWLLKTMK